MRALLIMFVAVAFLSSTEAFAARLSWDGWQTDSNKRRYRLEKNNVRTQNGTKVGAAYRIKNKSNKPFCAKLSARKGKNHRPRFFDWVYVRPGQTNMLGGWRKRNWKRKARIRATIKVSAKLRKCLK